MNDSISAMPSSTETMATSFEFYLKQKTLERCKTCDSITENFAYEDFKKDHYCLDFWLCYGFIFKVLQGILYHLDIFDRKVNVVCPWKVYKKYIPEIYIFILNKLKFF